jgi:glycosyltransferase involved in cell wall biosynthesis
MEGVEKQGHRGPFMDSTPLIYEASLVDSPIICLNGRFLDQEMTGVQRYARGMLASLAPGLQVLRPKVPLSPARGHLWEQLVLPRRCGRSLLWSPGNTGPLTKANQVVTVHDASTLDHPEWFSGKFAVWYRFLLPRLARRVRKIITVSQFSKERLIATCSIPDHKIAVIPNAVDARFQPVSAEAIEDFRRRHRLERPYCLYVGSLEPRKNVSLLLKAWADLAPPDCELILAGTAGHVFREKGFTDLPVRTRLFGRVADDELPTLLSAARVFIFPSLYEGFGFPPLEAMACGCPVICSNSTSLPEIGGPEFDAADPASTGAVLYFNPTDREQLAHQIRRVMEMPPEEARRMSRNGIAWAGRFNWDRCASQTWAALKELALS